MVNASRKSRHSTETYLRNYRRFAEQYGYLPPGFGEPFGRSLAGWARTQRHVNADAQLIAQLDLIAETFPTADDVLAARLEKRRAERRRVRQQRPVSSSTP